MKRVVVVALVALVAVPFARAARTPTTAEKARIVKGLPAFYHQPCIRTKVRISTVDAHYASVWFTFVKPNQKGCSPFDGQVIMKRVTATTWKKILEGSSWDCRMKGVPKGVIKDVIGTCIPPG